MQTVQKSLGFSDVVVEFGKLIYFTLNGDYPIPQKYFLWHPMIYLLHFLIY